MTRIRELEVAYAVPLQKYGKYVKIRGAGIKKKIVLEVKNQSFDIGHPFYCSNSDDKDRIEFIRIMLCQALNVMFVLEDENIDTSDMPETDLSNATSSQSVNKEK